MANSTSITPVEQTILGAFIAVSVAVFAFLDAYFNSTLFYAVVVGYAVVSVAYGVYLIQNSTAIGSYWKYLAIIIVTTVAFGLTQLADQWMALSSTINPVLIAGFVIVVTNFALNDAQQYYQYLPDSVINEITYILGAIMVIAEAVKNAPAGSIVNVTTLLTVAVPVLMVYLFQTIPWPAPAPAVSVVPVPAPK
jgi:hypothetical protein